MNDSDRMLLGRELSHYLVQERVGAGGMGVVYRARDRRLDRSVALKVLPAGLLRDENARRRLEREARALAKLSHPNIGTVYAFDEQGGIAFLAMEFIEGRTLADLLQDGALPPAQVVELGVQLAEGLAAAHAAGIVHRDLKPGNIMVTPQGRLKILDFGLAKLLEGSDQPRETSLTGVAAVVGTVPYMAPEQVRGGAVDERTDLYAVGTVLYEMAAGKRPFAARHGASLVHAILYERPPAPSGLHPRMGSLLEAVILKALEKEAAQRYQSARELLDDLRRTSGVLPGKPLAARRRLRLPRSLVWGLFLAACVGVAVGIWLALETPTFIESVAVVPFHNATGEPSLDYLADGLGEGLILRLSQLQRLKVIARASVLRYRGRSVAPEVVGRELGVRAVLTGRVFRRGRAVAVSVELVDTRDRHLLWGDRRESNGSDTTSLLEELARALIAELRPSLGEAARERFTRRSTRSRRALELYLRGRHLLGTLERRSMMEALRVFRHAIDEDPLFALAHVGLADAYYHVSNSYLPPKEAMPRVAAAAHKALEIDPSLGPAHALLGTVTGLYEWRWAEAEDHFRKAIALNPGYARAHHHLGILLAVRGRLAEAQVAMDRARELDPLSMSIALTAAWPAYFSRRFKETEARARRLIALQPRFQQSYLMLAYALRGRGRLKEALAAVDQGARYGRLLWLDAARAQLLAESKRTGQARRQLARLMAARKKQHFPAYDLAVIHAWLGDRDEAFRWLEQTYRERGEDLTLLALDPRIDPLRGDRRFRLLLAKMGLADVKVAPPPHPSAAPLPGRAKRASGATDSAVVRKRTADRPVDRGQ